MNDKRVILLGDIHGDFKPVRSLYQSMPYTLQKTDNTLVLLGDAGLNFFFNYRDANTKAKLGKYPFTYFVIRGNHEQRPSICMEQEPSKWHIEDYWGNQVYVENDYPYIKYALDTVAIYNAEFEGQSARTLVIPGAYSVDKYKRLSMGWSWFEQEQLSKEEMEAGMALIRQEPAFDVILSHTCPIHFEPTDLFLPIVDQSTVEKDMERYLGGIEYEASYKLWCWGHYHRYREYIRETGEPSYENPRQLMLFNGKAVDLKEALYNPNILKGIEF